MSDEAANISKLPVRFKTPQPPERVLVAPAFQVEKRKCYHMPEIDGTTFIVDESLATVECSACHERLDPMWVLGRLTKRDAKFAESHVRYNEEMKRLSERSKTKCDHCGKMTRISRAKP